MAFYQIVEFVLNSHAYFCIWFSTETEGFLSENGSLLFFENFNLAKSYTTSHNISLDNDVTTYYVDEIEYWATSSDDKLNCLEILNFWNIIQDVVASTSFSFLGNKRTKTIDEIYNKLFCGNNVLVDNEEDKYYPNWSSKEIVKVKDIILNGVIILKKSISK